MSPEEAARSHGEREPPLLPLDHPRCTDSDVAGAKAAWLARGLAAGLPVLPGWVVTAPQSGPHLAIGVQALARRGSGGARLEMSQTPLAADLANCLVEAVIPLGDRLVVRSSSVLEGGSEWSGAFTSYLDVGPTETPRAVVGCWASAFGVSTLERHRVAAVPPGSAPMAVLVQPALKPDFGGTARIEGDDVMIVAVAGSPAPLVQGWEPGATARVPRRGPGQGTAVQLMGDSPVESVARAMWDARRTVGATACEWAVADGKVHLLQLRRPAPVPVAAPVTASPEMAGDVGRHLARLVRRFPGPLGESLVLPWAVGDLTAVPGEVAPAGIDIGLALTQATEHAAALAAGVWSLPEPAALTTAARVLREVRGPRPAPAFTRLSALRPPDPGRAALVLSLLAGVRSHLAEMGAVTWPELAWHLDPETIRDLSAHPHQARRRQRFGFDRWEPFIAAVTMTSVDRQVGTAAAPGIGAGRMCYITRGDSRHFRPRDIVVAPRPTPDLAPLLWDASGLVTLGGGPGAHLFESARALAIPAVCSVNLEELLHGPLNDSDLTHVLAVDGGSGSVYATEW